MLLSSIYHRNVRLLLFENWHFCSRTKSKGNTYTPDLDTNDSKSTTIWRKLKECLSSYQTRSLLASFGTFTLSGSLILDLGISTQAECWWWTNILLQPLSDRFCSRAWTFILHQLCGTFVHLIFWKDGEKSSWRTEIYLAVLMLAVPSTNVGWSVLQIASQAIT